MATNDQAKFALVMEDETAGPAREAADRLERLKRTIEGDRRALSQLERQMRAMKKGGSASSAAFQMAERQAEQLRKKVAVANEEFTLLGGHMRRPFRPPKTRKAEGRLGRLRSMFRGVGDQADASGVTMGRFGGMASRISRVAGRGGLAGVLAGLALVYAAAHAALAKYAVGVANAARNERMRLEVLGHLRGRSKTAIADAEGMQSAIDRVAHTTGYARDELAGYAESAYRAGLRGKALESAVRGAGVRGAALGERYGKSFVFMAASAARAGQDIEKMADDAEERFGGLAQRRMMSMGNLARRMKQNIEGWFGNIKIEGLLQSLSRFVGLFSKGNEVGKAWGDIMSSRAQSVIGWIEGVVNTMAEWVEKTTLYVLKARNIWQAFLLQLRRGALSVADALEKVGISPEMIKRFAGYGKSVAEGLRFGVGPAGINLGIHLAKDMAEGFRNAAGIRSPSRLFAGYGEDVSAGMEQGVDRGADGAHRAVEDLISVPSIPPAEMPDGSNVSNAVDSSSRAVNIYGDFVFNGSSADAEGFAEQFRAKLADILSGAAVQMGAA